MNENCNAKQAKAAEKQKQRATQNNYNNTKSNSQKKIKK